MDCASSLASAPYPSALVRPARSRPTCPTDFALQGSMERSKRRPSPQANGEENGDHLSLSIDSSDITVDSTMDSSATLRPSSPFDTESAGNQARPCPCKPYGALLADPDRMRAQWQEQGGFFAKSLRDIEASDARGLSAEQSIKPSLDRIDELNESNTQITQGLKTQAQQVKDRENAIIRHQIKAAEAVTKAKKNPLLYLEYARNSTVYEIPESLGRDVLHVGLREDINQELENILSVKQALGELHLIWDARRRLWLTQLLIPDVKNIVPTGWMSEGTTGFVRPCDNLHPRIPDYPDDNAGIVLSRIGDLKDDCRRLILQRCYGLEGSELEKVLAWNDQFRLCIYLGRCSQDMVENLGTVSDIDIDGMDGMDGAAEESSVTTLVDEPLETVNLPVYLDHVAKFFLWPRFTREFTRGFAQEIAHGYAILHFGARLDGEGIASLLGLSPAGRGMRTYITNLGDCRPIDELTAQCVRERLVPAAFENDPYIPRPVVDRRCSVTGERHLWDHMSGTIEDELWLDFRNNYLAASYKIWEASKRDFDQTLPQVFIEELEKQLLEQRAQRLAHGHLYTISIDNNNESEQTDDQQSEQGEINGQEDSEYDGDENGQSQEDAEPSESAQYAGDGDITHSMGIDGSSDEEEIEEDEDDELEEDVD